MKIVSILGSPHGLRGNTGRLLELVLEGVRSEGAPAEAPVWFDPASPATLVTKPAGARIRMHSKISGQRLPLPMGLFWPAPFTFSASAPN